MPVPDTPAAPGQQDARQPQAAAGKQTAAGKQAAAGGKDAAGGLYTAGKQAAGGEQTAAGKQAAAGGKDAAGGLAAAGKQAAGGQAVTATRRELLDRLASRLKGLYDAREARSIALRAVSELSGIPEPALLADPGAPLAFERFDQIADQLAAGRPVQYVVGHTEFYGHRFTVREGVLIPRPETEELVHWVARDERAARNLVDVGTGSGCIAASLALALPEARVSAADISPAALDIAAENCRTLGARVDLRRADALHDLTDVFPGPFDAIVSNPPYVPQGDRASMHVNVREYEPREALFVPDDDPLRFYRAIARAGRRMLRPGGRLYFEIYEHAADAMRRMLGEEGYTGTEVRNDIQEKPRMVCSRLK